MPPSLADGLILEGDRCGGCKDDVEMGIRKQVCFSSGKPYCSGVPLTLRIATIAARPPRLRAPARS